MKTRSQPDLNASSGRANHPDSRRGRARRAFTICGLIGIAAIVVMLLAAGGLLAATSTYPNAQRVSDEGMQVFGSCPTYGAQVGSVRSPLCSWSISRQDWYESEDAMPEVYRWYQARERTWTISMGRFHAWLAIDRVQPAAPVNGLARFGVGRGLWIWLGQR